VSAKFYGSPLASEFLAEWSTGLEVSEYCSQFFRESGVTRESTLGREFGYVMWAVHAAINLDKLEPRSVSVVEHLCRRAFKSRKLWGGLRSLQISALSRA